MHLLDAAGTCTCCRCVNIWKRAKPFKHVRIKVPNFLLFSFFPGEAKRFIWK